MGKFRLALLILIAIPAWAKSPPTVTLSKTFLADYVAQKENVKAEDVRRIILKKDKTFKDGVVLVYPIASCGVGLCSYYTFIKNARGSFDFAGHIDGQFQSTNEIKESNLPEIVTQTKSGADVSGQTKWRYSQASKVYEAR